MGPMDPMGEEQLSFLWSMYRHQKSEKIFKLMKGSEQNRCHIQTCPPKTRWMYLLNFLRNPPAMNKIAATQKRFQHFGRTNFSIHTLSPPTISYPKTLPSSIIFHPNLTQPHPTYPNPTNLGKTSSPQIRREDPSLPPDSPYQNARSFQRFSLCRVLPPRSDLESLGFEWSTHQGTGASARHRHGTGIGMAPVGYRKIQLMNFMPNFHLSWLVASKLMVLTVKCMEIMHPSDRGCWNQFSMIFFEVKIHLFTGMTSHWYQLESSLPVLPEGSIL